MNDIQSVMVEQTDSLSKLMLAFGDAMRGTKDSADELKARIKKDAGDVRDSAEKLRQGIERFNSAINNEQLAKTVEYVERLTEAMERLDKLEKSGSLPKVLAALASSK